VKQHHIKKYFYNARSRAKAENLPFELTYEYLLSIATDECPIFKTPFTWGESKLGKGKTQLGTPQLDKIIPELGYVIGNVAFLSRKANKMKDNGTMQEHYAIADWIWEHTHAKKRSTTPVPTINSGKSQNNSKHRASTLPRFGEDSDDTNDYRGATQGENSYCSAKEGSGDSMGHGGKEMGAPATPKDSQDIGDTESTVNSAREFFERVLSKSRELDLVVGATRGAIQQSDHRRVESLQRSFDEKIQSLEETLKELREAHYSDRNTDTTRDG
jgi:hypothetical protein